MRNCKGGVTIVGNFAVPSRPSNANRFDYSSANLGDDARRLQQDDTRQSRSGGSHSDDLVGAGGGDPGIVSGI